MERRTVLLLVRHGQSRANVDGRIGGHGPTPLTELGHRQARATARALAERFAPTALVSSDLIRARQTAEPIAEATGLSLALDPDLRERTLGIFDDLAFDECERQYPDEWAALMRGDHEACPPRGERISALHARVAGAIDRLVAAHPGGRVAVVSHGLAMYHAFRHITGLGPPGGDLSSSAFLLVDNCSVSRYEHADGRWTIRMINDTSHL